MYFHIMCKRSVQCMRAWMQAPAGPGAASPVMMRHDKHDTNNNLLPHPCACIRDFTCRASLLLAAGNISKALIMARIWGGSRALANYLTHQHPMVGNMWQISASADSTVTCSTPHSAVRWWSTLGSGKHDHGYDEHKIEKLVPDYDDIRENQDVIHTRTSVEDEGSLAEQYQKGGAQQVAKTLAEDVEGAFAISKDIAEGAVQGVQKVARATTARAEDLLSRAGAAVTGSHYDPPAPEPKDRYKRMRRGGGAAHDDQDSAYQQWFQEGEPSIEEKYPRQVESAKLQQLPEEDVSNQKKNLETIKDKQKGEYESG